MIFRSWKFSFSTSNGCPVTLVIRSQWRVIIAYIKIIWWWRNNISIITLWAINSRSGQHSLKSSIFFFKSLKACHSLRAFGSFRHLEIKSQLLDDNIKFFTCSENPTTHYWSSLYSILTTRCRSNHRRFQWRCYRDHKAFEAKPTRVWFVAYQDTLKPNHVTSPNVLMTSQTAYQSLISRKGFHRPNKWRISSIIHRIATEKFEVDHLLLSGEFPAD